MLPAGLLFSYQATSDPAIEDRVLPWLCQPWSVLPFGFTIAASQNSLRKPAQFSKTILVPEISSSQMDPMAPIERLQIGHLTLVYQASQKYTGVWYAEKTLPFH
jgi:hypothetical protein